MNEISKILNNQEKTIWEGKPKANTFFISQLVSLIIFGGIAALVLFFMLAKSPDLYLWVLGASGILLLMIILSVLNYRVAYYVVTDKRIIIQSGIIGRDFKSLDYDQIKNISANVGLIDKLSGAGTIQIFTGEIGVVQTNSGGGINAGSRTVSKFDSLLHIDNPYDLLKNIQAQLSQRKEKLYGGKN